MKNVNAIILTIAIFFLVGHVDLSAQQTRTERDLLGEKQIDANAYLAEATQRGIKNIIKIGISFSGKRFGIAYEQWKA